jgi:hypothetical protein
MHRRIVVVGFVAALAATGLATPAQAADPHLAVTTVANPRAQLISGTETLLRIDSDHRSVRVTENGHDITGAFRPQPDGSLLGLATHLRRGTNLVVATSAGRAATLRIVDHSITGPVFSGPQQHPFFCETTAFGLAPATQPDCSAPTVVTYQYKNTAGAFVPLADPTQRPADLATALVGGHPVPYVVRIETGTIDRAVYQTAALYDGAAPSPLRQEAGWNGKLVYTFGGGCNGGYHQGNSTGGVVDDLFLAQGYAVASSTLNVLDQNCSTMLSAEAAMMVKEHFVDVYGPVRYTIGWGGSGGAIQQYDIADAYPGILDGIVPGVSFPDPLSTIGPVSDCKLLNLYFAGAGSTFTAAQRTAVAGFLNYDTCMSWDASFANRISPTASCSSAIPVPARWDPVTNPDGVKCSLTQQLANQVGIDPRTGFARSPLDNVGVQYGLSTLNSGQISLAQFIALNQQIGGFDVVGNHVAQRSEASFQALVAAYAEDILPAGSQGLRTTPVIDQRTDLDQAGFLNDIHTTQWSYAMRARLQQANGTSANQVIIENQPVADQVVASNVYELAAMDAWLATITGDHRGRTLQQKVIEDKPAGLGDGCYLTAANRIVTTLTVPATGPCAAQYPVGKDSRLVAGGPAASNVLKCQLRPVNFADYRVPLTASDRAQLRATFPRGVCDYRRPSVGQVRPIAPWLSYGDGSVGTFGHAPAPVPIR